MVNNRFDSIVIGGGLAGLSCAAYLAKAGEKVVVFEQYSRPGGYCTSFSRKGITFDPGPHWIIRAEEVNNILKELSGQPLQFSPLNPLFRAIGPAERTDILLSSNRETFEGTIIRSFPDVKKESLAQLIDLALELDKEMGQMPSESPELMPFFYRVWEGIQMPFKLKKTLKYGRMTAEKFLDSLFPGEYMKGLRVALHMLVPSYGIPATVLLMWIALGLKEKAFSLRGGAKRTSDALAEAVLKNGGEIRSSKKVSKIKIQNKEVAGVVLEDGSEFDAKSVVSAMDAKQTFSKLIDPEFIPSDFKKRIDTTPITDAAFTVSIVTDINPSEYGFNEADTFVSSSFDIKELFTTSDPEKIPFRLTFPTLTDPLCRAEGIDPRIHGVQIMAITPFEFENNWRTGPELQRGKEYQELKSSFALKLIKRAEEQIPGLSEHILYLDIATPITYYRYTLNYHGASLGWKGFRFWKQKIPFIQGLYYAGHWAGGSGVHGAITSGKTAAELILRNE